ncbi:MAG: hypothetical protein U0441_07485 [Polyangiaceae bacterium]
MKVNRTLVIVAAAIALLGSGCDREAKARAVLAKHKGAFEVCREEIEKAKVAGWDHRCTLVASMALDVSLRDTGLDEARIRDLRDRWLDETGMRPLYVPEEKRPAANH